MSTPRCPRKLVFVCALPGALAVLLLASQDPARAVIGTPDTVTCTGQCEACIESEHTPQGDRCLKCGIAPDCLGGDPGLSSDFTEILKAHNGYRASHSTPALSWSTDVAKGAQDWANACTPDPTHPDRFAHSSNAFSSYGENLFWGTRTSATDAVNWWYDEIKRYDFNNPLASFEAGNTDSNEEVRHFTQVVWRDSKQLGCGVADCGGRNLWVCRYSPSGNFNAQNPGVLAANVPPPGGMPQTQSTGPNPQPAGGVTPQSTTLKTATVIADVDVYEAAGGGGENLGVLHSNNKTTKVSLAEPCQDNWCHVKGDAVPTGEGWVYSGTPPDDFQSLEF